MLSDVMQARIREYAPANAIEQENMLAELMQHYVLTSLSRSGLFSSAIFHGGTCPAHLSRHEPVLGRSRLPAEAGRPGVRVGTALAAHCSGLRGRRTANRDPGQETGPWGPYARRSSRPTPSRRHRDAGAPIRTRRLEKDPHQARDRRQTRRRDRPSRTSYLSFPTTAPITTQTLSSGFGTKTHAPAVPPLRQGARLVRLPLVCRAPDGSRPGAARQRIVSAGSVARPNVSRCRANGCSGRCGRGSKVSTGSWRATTCAGFFR